jgi:hypothetical protein
MEPNIAIITDISQLYSTVTDVVRRTRVIDVHTHLFPAEFRALNLYGIDNLLTYHYLVAEFFRYSEVKPTAFFALTTAEQAELIYQANFVDNSPISEAARGVLTIISALGIDPTSASLQDLRAYFAELDPQAYIDRVFDLAGIESVVMTNDPFDDVELAEWEANAAFDNRFHAALRIDRPLNAWNATREYLKQKGLDISADLDSRSVADLRRYLDAAADRMNPLYLAASLSDSFTYPSGDIRTRLIDEVMLPLARERSLPVMLMIGVRRGVNRALGSAGDGVGRADVASVERICAANPDLRFLITFLSRENQHELCVSARKFANLMPFGCWWFLNNPSIISEITMERLELLGTSFIPQHSDSRVLEQLIYKWSHSREIIAKCLTESYSRTLRTGYKLDHKQIERDVENLFRNNFNRWVNLPSV